MSCDLRALEIQHNPGMRHSQKLLVPLPIQLTSVNGSKRSQMRAMADQRDCHRTDSPLPTDKETDPFDCRLIPFKDLPAFLSNLTEDDQGHLRPPIPFQQLCFGHVEQLIGDRATRSLKHQLESVAFKSLWHQCYCIDQVIACDDLLCLSRTACSQIVSISRQQFHSYLQNYVQYLNNSGEKKSVGRPKLISDVQSREIIDEIRRRQLNLHPMTITNLCTFIFEKYKIPCSRRFVRDWISRHKRDVLIQFVKPAEQARANVDQEDLRRFYTQLADLLADCNPEMIYNCDETGFSRRVSSTKLRAVLCADSQPERAVYTSTPDESTVTLIACVNLAGRRLTPYVIIPTKTINKEFLSVVRPRKECVLVCHPNGFSTHAIFFDWFQEVFLPQVREQRQKMCPSDTKKKAVLIFDGFAGHESQALSALAADNHVMLIKIPAHSSHLTQPLDQQIFQTLKTAYRRECALEFIKDRMVRKLFKLMKAFSESFSPHIIRESWKSVGIKCDWNEEGDFTKIFIDSEVVIARMIPLSPESPSGDKRKRMKLKAPFGPVNLEQLNLTADNRCPLCRSPKAAYSDVEQSTRLTKDLDVLETRDPILEKREQKMRLSRQDGLIPCTTDLPSVIDYLFRRGRVMLTARKHVARAREGFLEWMVMEVVTMQTVRVKCQEANEPSGLDLEKWTTSSNIVAGLKERIGNASQVPDFSEQVFRILITLVTEGILDKRDPDPGARMAESDLEEFQFRFHFEENPTEQ